MRPLCFYLKENKLFHNSFEQRPLEPPPMFNNMPIRGRRMAQTATWEICHLVGHRTESLLHDGGAPTNAIVRISWSSVAVFMGICSLSLFIFSYSQALQRFSLVQIIEKKIIIKESKIGKKTFSLEL
jgi:hypothetical protein